MRPTVKVADPVAVGVPENTPSVDRITPDGSAPCVTFSSSGCFAPDTESVWEYV
jgi:hypothetical protein